MYLRKDRAGNAPGYEWPHDGAVIEVDDVLAEQLLTIPGGGFHIAEAPKVEPQETEEEPPVVEETETEEEPVAEEDDPAPKKSPGRPKLPRDSKGNIIRK